MKESGLPTWNLSDLYQGIDDPKIEADLRDSLQQAERFEQQYRGRILSDEMTGKRFFEALEELESIRERVDRVLAYAYLVFAADTQNPKHGALLQRTQERFTELQRHLLFFELEWTAVPEKKAEEGMQAPELSRYRHFLESIRKWAPHRLSEAEEKILEEKANTGIRAFQRLFDETINQIQFQVDIDGERRLLTEQEALALLYEPQREVRRAAAKGLTEGLERNASLFTFIFNQIVADHASDDRLRRFPDPMASRNLSNEIEPAAVDALLAACESYYGLVARYYRLKKEQLGLDQLYDYDRYAPMTARTEPIPFDKAKGQVLSAFTDFSPQVAEIASLFFEKHWIDAPVRPGKRGGAFSHGTVPSVHPYVFVNYLGNPRDVMTLAHELGHGVHQWVSRRQNYFNFDTPLTTAETASVFAEMLVFHRLQSEEQDPKKRLALLMEKLEESFATIFRQVVLCRFEQRAHAARRTEGELSPDRINQLWLSENRAMFGDALTLTDDYRWWWMYISHFIHSPFYTYAYAFGHLLVLALYHQYREEGETFVPKYLELLSAGGSQPPNQLIQEKIGLDITKRDFWQGGLRFLEQMVEEAEHLAEKTKDRPI
ncbi:MAG: M3 family oligoendopeptidase [Candidatus Manganitrophus sp.]|nr:M3 family oligoendopeptidase [Candidatus Manganitrophus sp.]WDT73238.1 MAG: M3 family oligoendopeptidase [Candidatus Manganitrophus sp.]